MILVTGATGFLGKRVCKKLDELNLEYKPTSLTLGIDLRNKKEAFEIFEKVNPCKVIHCASYVGGLQFGVKHPAEMFSNNLLMMINIFEACKDYGIERLVNPISNCAYPGKSLLFKESELWDGPLHESVLAYGMARKMSLVGANAYNSQHNLDTINLILPNMYGPEDHFEEERSHAMGALIMKIEHAKNKSLPSVDVWGTGAPVREWLYIDDGAEAMVRALNMQPYKGPINIGTAKGISIKDMAELIKKTVGYEGCLVFNPTKIDGAPYKTMDGSLGRCLLQWSPQITLEIGLARTIQWYERFALL